MNLNRRVDALERRSKTNRARLELWRNRRLMTGLGFVASLIVFTFLRWPPGQAVAIVIFLVVFPPLVVITRRRQLFQDKLTQLLAFYQRQQSRSLGRGQFPLVSKALPGRCVSSALHRDLNLFSENGVMGLWDEFICEEAREKAALRLVEGLASAEDINTQQNRIRKMAGYTGYFRRSCVEARRLFEGRIEFQTFKVIADQEGLATSQKNLLRLVCALWLLAVVLIGVSFAVPLGLLPALVFGGFGLLSLVSLGVASRLFSLSLALESQSHISTLFKRFEQLAALSLCSDHFPRLAKGEVSSALKGVERVSYYLSTQAHPIIHILINLILPWSAFFSLLMESKRKKLQGFLGPSVAEFIEMDLLASSSFFYRHQSSVFAELQTQGRLSAEGLFHPLLHRTQAISNDFEFPEGSNQILITGSNMSGKSTFLRTVAINQVLTLAGLPIFAKKMLTTFAPVVTCIQVSDSLDEGLSSFYAEVVCLKKLHEAARNGELYYFVDEIFRGTNNRERLIGSRSFLKALAGSPAKGFVTTHDLELAELKDTLQGLRNYHFRDEIEEGKMVFPYRVFEGVCPTTNALRIMQAEGLPID